MRRRKIYAAILALIWIASVTTDNTIKSSAYSAAGDRAVTFTENMVGQVSGEPNPVHDFYGINSGPYCHMLPKYVCNTLGIDEYIAYSPYCDNQYGFSGGIQYYTEQGRYFTRYDNHVPVRSDLIYLDWDGDGKADHVEFVYYVDDLTIYTVGGNIGPNHAVAYNSYSRYDPCILGYASPNYDGTGKMYTKPYLEDDYTEPDYSYTEPDYSYTEPDYSYTEPDYGYFDTDYGCAEPDYSYTEPELPDTFEYTGTAKIVSYVGAWLRSSMDFTESSKLGIVNTDQSVDIYSEYPEFYYVGCYLNGYYTYGYVHKSTVSYGSSSPTWSTSYAYVSSSIGCNLRNNPEYDDANILCILDTYQPLTILSEYNGWCFVQTTVNGYDVYGYVASSVISR